MATTEGASSPKIQFNIHRPAAGVRRVQHAAIDEHASLSAFAETALEHCLELP